MALITIPVLVTLGIIGLIVGFAVLTGLGVFGTGGGVVLTNIISSILSSPMSKDEYLKEILYLWNGSMTMRQDCMSQLTSELTAIAKRSLKLSREENKNTSTCCEPHLDRLASYIISENNKCTKRIPPDLRSFSTQFAADEKILKNLITNKNVCPPHSKQSKCDKAKAYLELKDDIKSKDIPCDETNSTLVSTLAKKKLTDCYKSIGSEVFGIDCTKTLSYSECLEGLI